MSSNEKANEKGGYDPEKRYKDYEWKDQDQYKDGPIADDKRTCRDCICCIIFVLFLIGCVVVAVLGFSNGDPNRVIYPYDDELHQCGRGDYEDYKYAYFYNVVEDVKKLVEPGKKFKVSSMCVSECPNITSKQAQNLKNKNPPEKVILKCKEGLKNNPNCEVDYDNYYLSEGLLGRFCFPKFWDDGVRAEDGEKIIEFYDNENNQIVKKAVKEEYITQCPDPNDPTKTKDCVLIEAINGNGTAVDASKRLFNWSFFSTDKLTQWLPDLYVTWPAILASVAWSFIIALLFLLFIRCCAGFVIYLIIILILACFIALSILFYYKADDFEMTGEDTYRKAMLALCILCGVLAGIWFIFICVMCNKIRLAIGLIECTGKYIHQNCCIIFVPFLFFILTIVWYVYWIFLSLYLYSSGEMDPESNVIANFNWDAKIRYGWWYHLFSLFYITAFLGALSQFVYASSACIWYFTAEKQTEDHPIRKSFWRAFRYHWGSLAFGSLIIAIIRFLMLVLEIFKKKVEETLGKDNSTAGCCFRCVICCLECCLNCIARTMEFINKHAYIEIALRGESFCTAAFEGFALIIKHLGRFSSLMFLGGLFTIFGELFIAVASGLIGYLVITKISYFSDDLNSPILPCLCFVMIGFVLGTVTMSVFGMSSDALMHAFLLDEELNKGQTSAMPELQKFMSEERS